MLTPQEIESQQFKVKKFGGYDMEMVDSFLDEILKDYSSLYKEAAVLKSKMKILVEKLEEYRSVDEAMRRALLVAQNMANELISGAKKQSEELTMVAKQEAERRIEDYKNKSESERVKFAKVKEATSRFIESRIREYAEEINKLRSLCDSDMLAKASAEIGEPEMLDDEQIQQQIATSLEATVKINDLAEVLIGKNSSSQSTSVSEMEASFPPSLDFLKNIGDKGVAVKVDEPDNQDISGARVYNIELHNSTTDAYQLHGDKKSDHSDKSANKFDKLNFGKNYDNNDQ